MRKPLRFVVLAVVVGSGGAITLAWAQQPAPPAAPAAPATRPAVATEDTPPTATAGPNGPDREDRLERSQDPGVWDARTYAPRAMGEFGRSRRRMRVGQMKGLQGAVEKLKTAKEGPEKEAATKELTQLLDKSFTRDLERREHEVAEIETRIKKLREQIDKRKKAKDEIINLRLKTIVNETQGLGFPGSLGFEHGEMLPGQMNGIGWAVPQAIPPFSVTPPAEQPEQP
jgi:hypothetical protein